ncbi:endoplasmic reticulum-Golgi intermediate compartment protein 3-like [Convolutriloba macropyga]|uniref:endoplasmic reticulum-Golgi intermediate compartment protein 3-like n=1 Tax=Convolutriloba macropyga TaxID=536237 RepID=UPI003F524628
MDRMLDKLRLVDAYPKTLEDFRIKTISGGLLTTVSCVLMLFLFGLELHYYFRVDLMPELTVDVNKDAKLEIRFDVTFPRMACQLLTVDAVDVSGEQHFDIKHEIFKTSLDLMGNEKEKEPVRMKPPVNSVAAADGGSNDTGKEKTGSEVGKSACGSCYGAESDVYKCCNTCDEIKKAYFAKGWALRDYTGVTQCVKEKPQVVPEEGCRLSGALRVSKISGNFHITPGASYEQSHSHVHDFQKIANREFNSTHVIHSLSFGEVYPDMKNPLDGTSVVCSQINQMHTYYVKLVPTSYLSLNGSNLHTHQYSVTKHSSKIDFKALSNGLPGVFFQYEFSPIMVRLRETPRSIGHLLTALCSIVGGVFTVASLVDSFIFQTSRVVSKKLEIGKYAQ